MPEGVLLVGDTITRKLVSAGHETTAVEAVAPRRRTEFGTCRSSEGGGS